MIVADISVQNPAYWLLYVLKTTMYTILLTLQIIAANFSFACAAVLLLQKGSEVTKLILVGCLCAFIQNAGYLLEMMSTNLDEVMIAIRLEYIGTAFIATMSMLFVFKYCRVTIVPWIKSVLLSIDVSFLYAYGATNTFPFITQGQVLSTRVYSPTSYSVRDLFISYSW